MGRRKALQFVPLGVIYTLLYSLPICAQLPRRVQRCLPYPTLAEEIAEMRAQRPEARVVIEAVKVQGATHLPDSIRRQLITSLKQHEFEDGSPWIEMFQQRVMDSLQRQGYFKAKVTAEGQLVSGGDTTRPRVSVTVRVEEGLQYRLRDIRFVKASEDDRAADVLVFSPEELRKQILLREGQLFNVAKIRDGLEALRKLYGTKGYIDFTAVPLTDADDDSQRISLVIELDEQKQFRVGKVEVLGLDERKESLLKWKLKPGDLLNAKFLDDFFKDNKSALPPTVSHEDLQVHRDLQNGTVDLVFDFRASPCPQREN